MSEESGATIGRPTLFQPEYVEQAKKLTLLGFTRDRLARFFEVSPSTVSNWMRDYDDFRKAIHAGRELADAEVALALHSRATGYKAKRVKVSINSQGQVTEHEYEEDVAPDVGAATFWLTARQPKIWRAIQSVQNLDEDGNPVKPPSLVVMGVAPDGRVQQLSDDDDEVRASTEPVEPATKEDMEP